MKRVTLLLLLGLGSLGCLQYRSGYCDENHMDCGPDSMCVVGLHRCVRRNDGSVTGTGGHDGGRDAGRDSAMDKGAPRCSVDANTCSGSTPFCDVDASTCRGCTSDQECSAMSTATRGCLIPSGAPSGTCVSCTKDTHCLTGDAPVCSPTGCVGCLRDSDCARFLPGVCGAFFAPPSDAAPSPAACITPAQAIYVQNTASCSDMPDAGAAGGTADMPFCSMQPVLGAISNTRAVVVVTGSVAAGTWTYADQASGKLLIIGLATAQQPMAQIASSGAPAFNMSSGDVTIRNLSFTSNVSMGLQATGGMLTLDHVKVDSCKTGGILLNGASFDIQNTTVTNNGVGTDNTTNWSGIYVKTTQVSLKRLQLSTIASNKNAGVLCAGPIDARDVLAYGNGGNVDIGSLCMFASCGTGADAGAACGAQP